MFDGLLKFDSDVLVDGSSEFLNFATTILCVSVGRTKGDNFNLIEIKFSTIQSIHENNSDASSCYTPGELIVERNGLGSASFLPRWSTCRSNNST